jgi:hypothetical protein
MTKGVGMATTILLLADGNPFEVIQRYLQRPLSQHGGYGMLLLMGLAVAAVWVVLLVWDRVFGTPTETTPGVRSVFDQLVQAHRLTNSDSQLLRSSAQQLRLPDPVALFVDPRMWQPLLAGPDASGLELRRLAEQLFGPQIAESFGIGRTTTAAVPPVSPASPASAR